MHRFDATDYLKEGSDIQKKAYAVLSQNVFPALTKYSPVLAGTIPLQIDIESSDLDVLCYAADFNVLAKKLIKNFGLYDRFTYRQAEINATATLIANFFCGNFDIEIFAQDTPVHLQAGYRHMIIEDAILQREGSDFREKIIALKRQGIKTEPAFAHLLGLRGNPYDALLKYGESQFGL